MLLVVDSLEDFILEASKGGVVRIITEDVVQGEERVSRIILTTNAAYITRMNIYLSEKNDEKGIIQLGVNTEKAITEIEAKLQAAKLTVAPGMWYP
jgi:hypothetical protein